jgi:hypothetical protein
MPKGVYERKTKEPDMSPPEEAKKTEIKTKLFPVVLNKNHCPQGEYEIVGYLKEAVKRKDAAGNWRVIEPEEFIKGEMKPHQSPGVGFGEYTDKATGRRFNPKIWAGTQIAVPVDEAKFLVSKKLAERADDFAA